VPQLRSWRNIGAWMRNLYCGNVEAVSSSLLSIATVSGADSMGTGARAPTFTNGWAHGGTVSRTANKKLTKLCRLSRKHSPKRLIVLLEPKRGGARPKNFSGAMHRTGARTFKFVPAPLATVPLSLVVTENFTVVLTLAQSIRGVAAISVQ